MGLCPGNYARALSVNRGLLPGNRYVLWTGEAPNGSYANMLTIPVQALNVEIRVASIKTVNAIAGKIVARRTMTFAGYVTLNNQMMRIF